MTLRTIALSALVAAAAGTGAQAAVTSFTNQASYDAAAGSQLFLLDFNASSGVGDGVFAGQVDFDSPQAATPGNVIFGSGAMTDAGSTTSPNGVGPISGKFHPSQPVFAMSMSFLSSGNPQTINLFDGSGGALGSLTTPSSGFFGLVSDTQISRFTILNGVFASTGGNDRFFIDDFQANGALPPVPLPAGALLMGTALAGFGAFRRRKHRS